MSKWKCFSQECVFEMCFLDSHFAEGLISWPFLSHLASALGSVTSTDRTIFFPLLTEYADSSRLRNAAETSHTQTQSQTEDQRLELWLISLSRTLADFGLHGLHLLKSFQHATQVSDAVLKCNLLVLAGMSVLQKLPNVDLQLRLRLLFPVKVSDVINKSKQLEETECGFNGQRGHLLFNGFEKSTEVQFTLVLPSISVQEYMLNSQNLIYVCVYIYSLNSKKYFFSLNLHVTCHNIITYQKHIYVIHMCICVLCEMFFKSN